MNKKISLGLTIALIFISITATFAITMTVSQNIYNGLISRLSNRFELYEGISAIDNFVRTNFYGDFDDSELLEDSASGYMKGLKDSGSFFMDPQQYIEYTRRMDGEGGIGISAKYNVEKGRLFITEVHQGSSAENAELQVDDAIIKVDDEQVNASNVSEIIESLQFGRRFDSVTITYERDGSRKTVTVLRGETKTAFSSYIGDVGYIRISGFYANTAVQGITSLILDLRGCDEGSADYAAAVADLLLPSGVESAEAIAKVVKKDGSVYKNYTSDTKAITFPNGIIVMVDGGTSGGAELLAAQLKSFSKGRLLGVSTAGNMTFQEIYALEDGSAISLTVAKVVANNNETYCDGEGIEPDIIAEIDPATVPATSIEGYNGDSQLQAAYSILTQ